MGRGSRKGGIIDGRPGGGMRGSADDSLEIGSGWTKTEESDGTIAYQGLGQGVYKRNGDWRLNGQITDKELQNILSGGDWRQVEGINGEDAYMRGEGEEIVRGLLNHDWDIRMNLAEEEAREILKAGPLHNLFGGNPEETIPGVRGAGARNEKMARAVIAEQRRYKKAVDNIPGKRGAGARDTREIEARLAEEHQRRMDKITGQNRKTTPTAPVEEENTSNSLIHQKYIIDALEGSFFKEEVMRAVIRLSDGGQNEVSGADVIEEASRSGLVSSRDASKALREMLTGRGEDGLLGRAPILSGTIENTTGGRVGFKIDNVRLVSEDFFRRGEYYNKHGEAIYAAKAREREEAYLAAKQACQDDTERLVVDALAEEGQFPAYGWPAGMDTAVIRAGRSVDVGPALLALEERGIVERKGGDINSATWSLRTPEEQYPEQFGHPGLERNATPNEQAVVEYLSGRSGDGYVDKEDLFHIMRPVQNGQERDNPAPALRSLVGRGIVEMSDDGQRLRLHPAGVGVPADTFHTRSSMRFHQDEAARYLRENPRDIQTAQKAEEHLSFGVSPERLLQEYPDVLEALPQERTDNVLSQLRGLRQERVAETIHKNPSLLQNRPRLRAALETHSLLS